MFEAVDIDKGAGERPFIALRLSKQILELLVEITAIIQASQSVAYAQLVDVRMQCFEFAHALLELRAIPLELCVDRHKLTRTLGHPRLELVVLRRVLERHGGLVGEEQQWR